jgi:hypothetical protein
VVLVLGLPLVGTAGLRRLPGDQSGCTVACRHYASSSSRRMRPMWHVAVVVLIQFTSRPPQCRSLRNSPMVFGQPKTRSTSFRLR